MEVKFDLMGKFLKIRLSRFFVLLFLTIAVSVAVVHWSGGQGGGHVEATASEEPRSLISPSRDLIDDEGRSSGGSVNFSDPRDHAVDFKSEIDRLVNYGTPQAFYEAAVLINRCVSFDLNARIKSSLPIGESGDEGGGERYVKEMTRSCSGVTKLYESLRLDYLGVAADAGVPGAAIALFSQGPFGDIGALEYRRDDPLVVEWIEKTLKRIEISALKGDVNALSQLSLLYQAGDFVEKDIKKAIVLEQASLEISRIRGGNRSEVALDFLKMKLGTEEVAAAVRQGKKLGNSIAGG